MTGERGLTYSDLKEGDVVASRREGGAVHLVLSSREGSVAGQVLVRLLDLREGHVFSGAMRGETAIVGAEVLRRGA